MANNVIFKVGAKSDYNALQQKDTHTLYWLTDVKEIRKGEDLYAVGREATSEAAGLMSAADKAKLDSLSSSGGLAGLTPVDASIIVEDGESGSKTIRVQLSAEEGNALVLKDDGLYSGVSAPVNIPEYTLERQDEAVDGYAATYRLKKTVGGESTYVGDAVNIPKDMVLQSGSLKLVEEADIPYEGAEIGDPYIDLVLNDAASTHIYIPMKGIIDTDDIGDTYITNGVTSLSEGAASSDITSAIGSYEALLAAVRANKIIVDRNHVGSDANNGTDSPKTAVYIHGDATAIDIAFMTASDTMTVYQIQNVEDTLTLGVTSMQYAKVNEIPNISGLQGIINSMPDEILSEIVNVQRTATTNTAEIRIFTKQEDGTYSPNVQHGVLTLIPAGTGPDGVNGAGLMTAEDKEKLDNIDTELITSLADSLVWGTM